MNLEGLNIFITGGSRGIGAGIAQTCSKLGANAIITYNSNKEEAFGLIKGLKNSKALHMNSEDPNSISEATKEAIEIFDGKVDGVVNNAGITKDNLMLRMSAADFSKVLDINLKGTFLVSKAFIKPMMKQKSGSFVHITSVIGQIGQAGQTNYAASKAGIEAFSRSMARELASRNIRSNCVAPGYVNTDMTKNLDEKVKANLLKHIPLNKVANVFEIAYPVCFLLSSDASYITGQTIGVNGGINMC